MIWSERTRREKTLLLVAAGLFVLFVLWQFMVRPVLNYHDNAAAQFSRAERDLQIVRSNLPLVTSHDTIPGPTFNRMVLIKEARKRGIALSRVQPEGDSGLDVWFDTVYVQQFYALMTDIVIKNGAVITRVHLASADPQTINAQVSFDVTH